MPASRHAAHSKCIKGKDTTTMTAEKKSPKLFAQWRIACAQAKNTHITVQIKTASGDRSLYMGTGCEHFFSCLLILFACQLKRMFRVWQLSSKLHLHDETIRFTFYFFISLLFVRFYFYFCFFFSTSCSFYFFEQTIRGVFFRI